MKIDQFEALDLAAAMQGVDPINVTDLSPEEGETSAEDIEEGLMQRFGITLEQLQGIAEVLVPMCSCDTSSLTGEFRRGFVFDRSYVVKQSLPVPSATL